MIRRLFSPPHFDDEVDDFRAKFLTGFSWIVIGILLIALLIFLSGLEVIKGVGFTSLVLSSLIVVLLLSLYVLHRGYVNASGLIAVVLVWLGLGFQAFTADGVRDVIIIAYIAVGLLASIVFSWRASGMVMFSSIIAIWILALLEMNAVFIPRIQNPVDYARDLTLIFITIAVLIYFSTNSLRDAITRAKKSEQSLIASNKSLQELNLSLEERVSNRTMEVEIASKTNEKRARQFEAVTRVAKVISTIQDLETLLPRIVQVISEQFGHYHTGIFLLDNPREYAVLQATNSPGGRKMLAREHKLRIEKTSIVGYVAETGQPRIALDVGADAIFFDNPDLPDTRSEIALPLRIAGKVVGVIDVQSKDENAFRPDDISALSTLADQVSIAIQNTRTLEEARIALAEAQSASGASIQEAWRAMRPQTIGHGFQWTSSTLKPLVKPLDELFIRKAVEEGQTMLSTDPDGNLAIPIRMRGQVIGVMSFKNRSQHRWTDDDVDIAEAVAARLALAIETASLLRTARHKAEIEKVTTEITSKIGASVRTESILKTTASELNKLLDGAEVLIKLNPENQ